MLATSEIQEQERISAGNTVDFSNNAVQINYFYFLNIAFRIFITLTFYDLQCSTCKLLFGVTDIERSQLGRTK